MPSTSAAGVCDVPAARDAGPGAAAGRRVPSAAENAAVVVGGEGAVGITTDLWGFQALCIM